MDHVTNIFRVVLKRLDKIEKRLKAPNMSFKGSSLLGYILVLPKFISGKSSPLGFVQGQMHKGCFVSVLLGSHF